MTKKQKQFELLMRVREDRKSGCNSSEEMRNRIERYFSGFDPEGTPAERYSAKKKSKKLQEIGAILESWPTDVAQKVEAMQNISSRNMMKPETVAALNLVENKGLSLWEASKEAGVYMHNVKSAHAKLKYFDKAAQEYQKLL